jgi:uncharacterized protein
MKQLSYALIPLLVLLAATFLACIVAYGVVLVGDGDVPFRKIIKKTAQLFLVLSIFPIMRYVQLGWPELGFAPRAIFFKQIGIGFGLGFITLLPVFLALYVLDVDVIDLSQPWSLVWLSKKLVIELLLALLISLFEEPLFRGLMLVGLQRKLSTAAAVIISAFYYAFLHFLDTKSQIPVQDIQLFSGFSLLAEAFVHVFNPEIFSAFLALFAVGIFLGLLRVNVPTSLGLCIGCHACWVWQIKLSKTLFNTNPNSDYLYLVSSYDGVIGPLVTGWLVMAMLGYWVIVKRIRCREF